VNAPPGEMKMDISYYKKHEPFFSSWYITKLIGQGNFGKVFEIERKEIGETYKAALRIITVPQNEIEIKSVMASDMDERSIKEYFESIIKDFVAECVLMSKLKGNNHVVSYEDYQVTPHEGKNIGWDILIRMELLTPLLDYAQNSKLTHKEVIKIGIDICSALEFCQKHNIIHRNIKPENIFVSESGNYKLGDIRVASNLEKTDSGLSKIGFQTCMAPEIYKGEEYDSSVDIYSLGIVMFRLLNNYRTPFLPPYPEKISRSDVNNALIQRIGGEIIPKPAEADGRLAEIVLKACSYNPKERYSSPMQMRSDLEAILHEAGGALSFLDYATMKQEERPLPKGVHVVLAQTPNGGEFSVIQVHSDGRSCEIHECDKHGHSIRRTCAEMERGLGRRFLGYLKSGMKNKEEILLSSAVEANEGLFLSMAWKRYGWNFDVVQYFSIGCEGIVKITNGTDSHHLDENGNWVPAQPKEIPILLEVKEITKDKADELIKNRIAISKLERDGALQGKIENHKKVDEVIKKSNEHESQSNSEKPVKELDVCLGCVFSAPRGMNFCRVCEGSIFCLTCGEVEHPNSRPLPCSQSKDGFVPAKFVVCKNRHGYSSAKYNACPYCEQIIEVTTGAIDMGVKVALVFAPPSSINGYKRVVMVNDNTELKKVFGIFKKEFNREFDYYCYLYIGLFAEKSLKELLEKELHLEEGSREYKEYVKSLETVKYKLVGNRKMYIKGNFQHCKAGELFSNVESHEAVLRKSTTIRDIIKQFECKTGEKFNNMESDITITIAIAESDKKSNDYFEVMKRVDEIIEVEYAYPFLGSCHRVWGRKKELLKREGITNWKSPAEENPDTMFD